MERYTYFDGGKWRMRVGDAEYSGKETDRLAAYEETGLEPEEIERILDSYGRGMTLRTENAQRLEIIKEIPINRLRELAQAEKTGQLAKFPFIAMVEQSLRDGTMKPMSDQKHNGRYAVVYKSERWTVPFPVSWTVKMKKKQKETQDILSYHTQAAGCSDKARAKASGGRQPIEECGRTGL